MQRNYLSEIVSMGKTKTSISRELGISTYKINKFIKASTVPKHIYESTRNVYRRTIFKTLRKAGYGSKEASRERRFTPEKMIESVNWLDNATNVFFNKWNRSYIEYKMNPKQWRLDNPNKKIPYSTTKTEVKRRIAKGSETKTKEEIENY